MEGPEWSQKRCDCTQKRCILEIHDSGITTVKSALKISEKRAIKAEMMSKYKENEANPSFFHWSQNAV